MSDAPRRPARRSSAHAGFTLLEVLAAVAVLALWYVALAGNGISSLRAEGESRRLLEAGMLADRHLADALASTVGGSVPDASEDVIEEGPYRIVTRFGGLRVPGDSDADDAFDPAPTGLEGTGDEAPPDLPGLLEGEMAGMAKHIRSLRVVVAWTDGEQEKKVERTTFVFDLEKAREIYDNEDAPGDAGTDEDGASAEADDR
jgi:prepilin-type N-terminal cleavage/methylation domain-containing protein